MAKSTHKASPTHPNGGTSSYQIRTNDTRQCNTKPAFARVTRSLIDSRTIRVPTGPDLALIITAAIPIQTRVWITPPLDIRIDAVFDRGGSHR